MLKQTFEKQTDKENTAQIDEARKKFQFHSIMTEASRVYLRYLELSQENTITSMLKSDTTKRETPIDFMPGLASFFATIDDTKEIEELGFKTTLSSDEDDILDMHANTQEGAVAYFDQYLKKAKVAHPELISNAFESSLRCSSPCKRVGHYLESPTNIDMPKAKRGFFNLFESRLESIIDQPPQEQDTQFELELEGPDLR